MSTTKSSLPSSFGALRDEAITMFKTLDKMRAVCHVHQITNGKADTDVYIDTDEVTRTYDEQCKWIVECERNLRQSLPAVVLRVVKARLRDEDEGE